MDAWLQGRPMPAFTSYTLDAKGLRSALLKYRRQGWALS